VGHLISPVCAGKDVISLSLSYVHPFGKTCIEMDGELASACHAHFTVEHQINSTPSSTGQEGISSYCQNSGMDRTDLQIICYI
jgi:hypothetical protein